MKDKPMINKEIKKSLRSGSSKSEIYKNLREDHVSDEELRKLLASKPCPDTPSVYKILHKIVSIFWILFASIELIGFFEAIMIMDFKVFISFAITIYLTVQIWRFNGDLYLPAIIWLGLSIFNAIKEYSTLSAYDLDYSLYTNIAYTYIVMVIIAAALMIIVRKNVFNYYSWFKPDLNYKNEILFEDYKTTSKH